MSLFQGKMKALSECHWGRKGRTGRQRALSRNGFSERARELGSSHISYAAVPGQVLN